MDLRVQDFSKHNVELLPDKIIMLSDTELSQYFIKSWSLDFNDLGTSQYNRSGIKKLSLFCSL